MNDYNISNIYNITTWIIKQNIIYINKYIKLKKHNRNFMIGGVSPNATCAQRQNTSNEQIIKIKEIILQKDISQKDNVYSMIRSYGPPEQVSNYNFQNDHVNFQLRKYFTENIAWAIPSKESVENIRNFIGNDYCLEIGSGHGLWAGLLRLEGVNIVATDNFLSHNSQQLNVFTEVEEIDYKEAMIKYSNSDVLFLCWSTFNDPLSYNCLTNFKGNKVVFIGEGEDGCTADDSFFKEIGETFDLYKDIPIPNWQGISDFVLLYTRRVPNDRLFVF
jgi:hypothetical protein